MKWAKRAWVCVICLVFLMFVFKLAGLSAKTLDYLIEMGTGLTVVTGTFGNAGVLIELIREKL